jgi:hypothetical protein
MSYVATESFYRILEALGAQCTLMEEQARAASIRLADDEREVLADMAAVVEMCLVCAASPRTMGNILAGVAAISRVITEHGALHVGSVSDRATPGEL